MEKIDLTKIRGEYTTHDEGTMYGLSQGDDTDKSLQTIAAKVNEIIDRLNREEKS